jgi:hypothetical protein
MGAHVGKKRGPSFGGSGSEAAGILARSDRRQRRPSIGGSWSEAAAPGLWRRSREGEHDGDGGRDGDGGQLAMEDNSRRRRRETEPSVNEINTALNLIMENVCLF